MGKSKKKQIVEDAGAAAEAEVCEAVGEGVLYTSPAAKPLLEGKTLQRALKLLKKTVQLERTFRANKDKKEDSDGAKAVKKFAFKRPVKRGVAEVTKAIRKGEKGIVFLASDIYPVDVFAHLPTLCEEKEVLYAYVGSKKTLGAACTSQRPASAIMITAATKSCPHLEVYSKASTAIQEDHPYM